MVDFRWNEHTHQGMPHPRVVVRPDIDVWEEGVSASAVNQTGVCSYKLARRCEIGRAHV